MVVDLFMVEGGVVDVHKVEMGFASSDLDIKEFKRWIRWCGEHFSAKGVVNKDSNTTTVSTRAWSVEELVVGWGEFINSLGIGGIAPQPCLTEGLQYPSHMM